MPLLLIERSQYDRWKNQLRTRIVAAEVCRVPKQTSNDEGRPQDLQMGAKKNAALAPLDQSPLRKQAIRLL